MRNYKSLFLIIVVIILIPVLGFTQRKPDDRDVLMDILEEVGGEFIEADIDMGGTIMEEFISKEEILTIGDKVRRELGIQGHMNLEEYYFEELVQEEGFIQLTVQGLDGYHNHINFTLYTSENEEGEAGETGLFINVINKLEFIKINDIILEIEKIFDKYQKTISITKCLVGTFNEDINQKDINKNLLRAMKPIKGKIVEKYKEDEVLSYSIYTPYIKEYIYTGSQKMNLNIGIRFNEYENKNYIWIGTPIISIGY